MHEDCKKSLPERRDMASKTMFSLLRIHTISFSCCRACAPGKRDMQLRHACPPGPHLNTPCKYTSKHISNVMWHINILCPDKPIHLA